MSEPTLNVGDLITMEGWYNRPPVRSLAWWFMLVLGAPGACRFFSFAFRRKVSDPGYQVAIKRRALFKPRALQVFRVKDESMTMEPQG